MTPDYTKPNFDYLYSVGLKPCHGNGITHYIRFFPDGTLMAVAAPDFKYSYDESYQSPLFILEEVLRQDREVSNSPFGPLKGTYTMKGDSIFYTIELDGAPFETGEGEFYGMDYGSCVIQALDVDVVNHYWNLSEFRGYRICY